MTCLIHKQTYSKGEYCIYCGNPHKETSSISSKIAVTLLSINKLISQLPDIDLKDAWGWCNTAYSNPDYQHSSDPSKRESNKRYNELKGEMERRGLL